MKPLIITNFGRPNMENFYEGIPKCIFTLILDYDIRQSIKTIFEHIIYNISR